MPPDWRSRRCVSPCPTRRWPMQRRAGHSNLNCARAARLPEVDSVMAAIDGPAGLRSTLAAAEAGMRLLLANKESLVMAGPLLMRTVRESGATLLPIDSEHNAVFQCLPRNATPGIAPAG